LKINGENIIIKQDINIYVTLQNLLPIWETESVNIGSAILKFKIILHLVITSTELVNCKWQLSMFI